MKRFYYLLAVLLAVVVCAVTVYALTAEEMLLLKRGGISDEKILEIQKKRVLQQHQRLILLTGMKMERKILYQALIAAVSMSILIKGQTSSLYLTNQLKYLMLK